MIILEYILERYALFVKHYADKCASVSEEDLKYNIAVFSRIISSNSDAVREFILDGFENEILDIGYLCFISLMWYLLVNEINVWYIIWSTKGRS